MTKLCLLTVVYLQERSPDKLKQFFDAYGAPEAAAMCYLVATQERQSMVSCKATAAACRGSRNAPTLNDCCPSHSAALAIITPFKYLQIHDTFCHITTCITYYMSMLLLLQRLAEDASNALDNPLLVGQPLMPEEGAGTEAAQNAGSAGGGIYMGT